jgi:siderophore synthetase component
MQLVEHEIKSSSTSEAGQLPAGPHSMKQLETYHFLDYWKQTCTSLLCPAGMYSLVKKFGAKESDMQLKKKKKEVTWSELATTLLTMTRKTGLSGTQATTRRRCYLRKIARHTQSAPPAHSQAARNNRTNKDMVQMYCSGHSTQVLPRSVDGNARTDPIGHTARGDRNGK